MSRRKRNNTLLSGLTAIMLILLIAGTMAIIKLTAVLGPSSYLLFIILFLIVALIGFHLWTRYRSTETAQQVADLMKEGT